MVSLGRGELNAVVIDVRGAGSGQEARSERIVLADRLGAGHQVRHLLQIARSGLPRAFDRTTGEFAQTMRRTGGSGTSSTVGEGRSVRYAAIAALGLGRLPDVEQRALLGGTTAADLARSTGARALAGSDAGATALAAWATSEITGTSDTALIARLGVDASSGRPLTTVELSWMLTAVVAAGAGGESIVTALASRLLDAQGPRGIFPHMAPAAAQRRWRRHVGSFADQVYPIQALARASRFVEDPALLDAAEAVAHRICDLQGPAGQWWWHYDVRTGDVVERYPVYSVHQHAMAPMTLFELADAGGTDRTRELVRGLKWLDVHPEVDEDLASAADGVIWRKAGRREPGKATRGLSAVTTSMRPGLHLPLLDRTFPANRVDHECRPYELGWLLYAWLAPREATHHD